MFSKDCVSLVRSHVEQTLVFSKATSDVVTRLVGIALVYFWEFRVVIDEE